MGSGRAWVNRITTSIKSVFSEDFHSYKYVDVLVILQRLIIVLIVDSY